MTREEQLMAIKSYIYNLFQYDVTGHDYHHMERVAKIAKDISLHEKKDPFICEAAAWVHDVCDKKLTSNPNQALNNLELFLKNIEFKDAEITQIKLAIKDISFSQGNIIPDTIEGKIVQDADRLDAIGAIGIARTFAYGGANSQLIYNPLKSDRTSVQHFYDKLLKLKDSINSQRGKVIAEERHDFILQFLKQFHKEW